MNDLCALLDSTRALLTRYVVFATEQQADACALWVGYTWTQERFDTAPYLAVQSAERRSGKTRLLECLGLLVREPLPVAGATTAALFRVIDERHPTLLLDEADTIFGRRHSDSAEDLRGLLNNGYRRGRPYWRVVGSHSHLRTQPFDVFCAKVMASIGELPDTVQDRSIVIRLDRRTSTQLVARFRLRIAEREAAPIRKQWASAALDAVRDDADVPDELHDRAADNWEPLIGLADAAGGDWPARARRAALALSAETVDDDRPEIRLLADIREIFAQRDVERLATSELIDELRREQFAESGWEDWRGAGLKPVGLASLLRPFGIRARQMKLGGVKVRGFERAQFSDAFLRYLPSATPATRYPGTDTMDADHRGTGVPGRTTEEITVPPGSPDGRIEPTWWHPCHHCKAPIEDVGDAFFDARTNTFWHRAHWQEQRQ